VITTLSNGIRVATERTATSGVATVGVYFGAGSRQDTLATSGAAHNLRNMLLKGTSARSKGQLAEEIESMGGRLSGNTGREQSHISLTVFKGDVRRAINILGDAVSNATIDAAEFEIQKQSIAQDHANNHNEYEYTTLENAHYNSFRDHMMGQPVRGDADNLSNLTVTDL